MLIRYGAANHLSICDYQEISLVASKLKDDDNHLIRIDEKSIQGEFLPVVALYGANAAGKSNMVNILRHIVWSVKNSFRNDRKTKEIYARPCKVRDEESPGVSEYDCDVLIDGVRYQYGFNCNEYEYTKEWLYSYPNGSKTILFERGGSDIGEIRFGSSVRGIDKTLQDIGSNLKALFLSSVGQTSHGLFKPIHDYFVSHFAFVGNGSFGYIDEDLLNDLMDPSLKRMVEAVLRQADFGVYGLEINDREISDQDRRLQSGLANLFKEMIPDADNSIFKDKSTRKELSFVHKCGEKEFRLNAGDESTGTIYLLRLLIPAFLALKHGRTLVIDEITTALHTKLSEELVRLFSNRETNPKGAQFIFTTHDTNLLSYGVLRRDEIWFVEKSDGLATSVFPLTDFSTRKTDNLEVAYLMGRYGAVPTFGDLTRTMSTFYRQELPNDLHELAVKDG